MTAPGPGCSSEHNVRIRAAIDRFRGLELDTAGDGFVALFDGAAKAVRAALLMDPSVADLGIRVRVGIHTGEVEIVGGRARGVAVHTAARVASLAGCGRGARLGHHPRPPRRLGPRARIPRRARAQGPERSPPDLRGATVMEISREECEKLRVLGSARD